MKQITLDGVVLTPQQIESVKAQLAEVETEPDWPKAGDKYYYVSSNGDVCFSYWSDTASNFQLECGNVFRTDKEAISKRDFIESLCPPVPRSEIRYFVLMNGEISSAVQNYPIYNLLGRAFRTLDAALSWVSAGHHASQIAYLQSNGFLVD